MKKRKKVKAYGNSFTKFLLGNGFTDNMKWIIRAESPVITDIDIFGLTSNVGRLWTNRYDEALSRMLFLLGFGKNKVLTTKMHICYSINCKDLQKFLYCYLKMVKARGFVQLTICFNDEESHNFKQIPVWWEDRCLKEIL